MTPNQPLRTGTARSVLAWLGVAALMLMLASSLLLADARAQKAGEYTPAPDQPGVVALEAGDHAPPDPDAPQSSVRVIEEGDFGRTGVADGPANNQLEIRVHGCAPGYDAASRDHSQLLRDCTVNPGSTAFAISAGNRGALEQWTSGSDPNIVTFTELPTDDNPYSLTYTRGLRVVVTSTHAPALTRAHVVTCSYWDEPDGEVDYGPVVMEMVDKTSVMVEVDNRDTVSCDWFFVVDAFAVVPAQDLDPGVDPVLPVTPVIRFPVPTATPGMPQVDVTLPIQDPIVVVTPIIIEPLDLAPDPGDRD